MQLRQEAICLGPIEISDEIRKLELEIGVAYEFEAEMEWEDVKEFGLHIRASASERTRIGYHTQHGEFYLDRINSGFTDILNREDELSHFAKTFVAPHKSSTQRIKIHGFIDDSLVECFIDDGVTVFTSIIYPDPGSRGIELFAMGGTVHFSKLTVYPLHSIWF